MHYFYIIARHRQNPWLAQIMEPLDSTETRLKTSTLTHYKSKWYGYGRHCLRSSWSHQLQVPAYYTVSRA